jgi:aldehyde:ferredoxin oxidoreductase
LYRLYNHREGLGAVADTLPDRFFQPLEAGALKGEKLDREQFHQALRTYYRMMGWDVERGIPTPELCAELEIEWALAAV